MDNLFTNLHNDKKSLAEKMRPKTLDDFVGQQHILGKGKFKLLENGKLTYTPEVVKRHRKLIKNG